MAKRATAITCLALLVLFGTTASRAIRYDWTPEEVACAATLGVDLTRSLDSSSFTFERHLSWVADVVAYGTVEEVTHDIRGPYHTIVTLRVKATQKGVSEGHTVFIDLLSGPVYSRHSSQILEGFATHEPSFAVGEQVLVFLTATLPADDPYAHAEGHYSVIGETGKWLVEGTVVRDSTNPYHLHTMEWMNDELSLAISAQSKLCN